ncbi:MAG: hypothetical protein ACJARO_001306 [Bacteriovoracaceae bacterium]|jgi:hypothetical protein
MSAVEAKRFVQVKIVAANNNFFIFPPKLVIKGNLTLKKIGMRSMKLVLALSSSSKIIESW